MDKAPVEVPVKNRADYTCTAAKPIKINDIPTDPIKILENIYIQRTQIVAQSATFQVLNVN